MEAAKPKSSRRSQQKNAAGNLKWGYNMNNKGRPNFGVSSYAKELQEMPDYSNAQTKET